MNRSLKDIYQNGLKLLENDKYEEAIPEFETLINLRQMVAGAYIQRGRCHWEMHRWAQAQSDFNDCLTIDPNSADAMWTVGLIELQLGNFKRGWEMYDHRWETSAFNSPRLKTRLPLWESGKGYKSVLVWCEQGIGDQLIYASMLNSLKKQVDKMTVMIDIRLKDMLKRVSPDINFVQHDHIIKNSEYDSQIPLGSVGRYFINEVSDIPKVRSVGFIRPDLNRVEQLKQELNIQPDDFVIGLSWASTAPRIDKHKSVQLEKLLGLWDLPNVKIVNLQYGKPDYDIEPFEEKTGKTILQTTVNNFFDLEGVVAIMSMCNAVVSVSNANVHLAGALGVPTYVLDANKLWYWNHKEGRTSYFYPTVKLFPKQNIEASWDKQIEEVIEELKIRIDSKGQKI